MSKKVHQAMSPTPRTVSRSDSVVSAARVMEEEDVGSLPVVDLGFPVGIVTDRDITIRVVAQGMDPNAITVGEIASDNPYYVTPDEGLDEALELMAYRQVRRLLVVDDDQLVGILAQADVVHEVKDKKAGQLVEQISQT
jgi:CBS domain-containing protein